MPGGFAAVTDEQLGRFTDRWTQRYIHDELNDFQEKSARFTYLFRRLCQQVRQVVADMAHELRAATLCRWILNSTSQTPSRSRRSRSRTAR